MVKISFIKFDQTEKITVRDMKMEGCGISLGVSGVVIDEDRVLVIQRNDTKGWALPGGAVESGESLEAAVAREIKEETGLDVTALEITGIYIRNRWRNNILFVHKCKRVGGNLKKSEETDNFQWIQPNEENLSKIDRNSSERIRDCLAHSDDVVVKLQNYATIEQIILWKWRNIKKVLHLHLKF